MGLRNRVHLKIRLFAMVVVASTVTFVPTWSAAQTDSRTTTVTGRDRPELDPLGLRISGFILSPSVGVGETFSDNIFATQNGQKSDFVTTVFPAVKMSSDWNLHSLQFSGSGDIARYASNTNEDHETFELKADGRLDLYKEMTVSGDIGYQLDSEERGSVDDARGGMPTEFTVNSLGIGVFNKWNRVSIKADGQYQGYDFDDVTTNAGLVNNDDRDRDEYQLDTRIGYEIQSEYEAFVQLIWTSVNYDSAVDDNGLNRDNAGYEARVGTRVDLTGLLFGDVFVGYINRDYDGATLRSVDTVVGGLDLTWNMTRLTTIKGGFGRLISETTLAQASGSVSTMLKASVDHELLRSLILSASSSVSSDEFEGNRREDNYLKAGFGAKYILNRNFSILMNYDYSKRDSNVSGADNQINKVFLRIQGQL